MSEGIRMDDSPLKAGRAAETCETRPPAAFAVKHNRAILFIALVLCLIGGYAAYKMPSSVFPQTDFPRVVILVDSGVMPGDEMMATITRPIEEAMKDIPGAVSIRSATGRGSAEVNVFFDWKTDMVQAELYVLSRISQIKSTLPASASLLGEQLALDGACRVDVCMECRAVQAAAVWQGVRSRGEWQAQGQVGVFE